MDASEPLQVGDHLWYFDFDAATQLHTLTIKTVEGVVKTRTTMTSDQLREFTGTLGEVYAQAMEITPEKIIDEPGSGRG